ncbi:MAG: hypothetical protein PVG92_00625 [Holophagae bacterium]|jgi:hypothetical protein
MRLLLVIVHREDVLDEVLSALVEAEAPDSVVVDSRSGLELLERDLPIFAGLRSLVPAGLDFSAVVLCAFEDEGEARQAMEVVARIEPMGKRQGGELPNTVVLVPVAGMQVF